MSLIIPSRAHNRRNIEQATIDYLATMPDYARFKDMFQSSVGKVLLELLCGIAELLIYKADVKLLEQYLFTAVTKEAVYLIADMLGYPINRKASATGTVKITFKYNTPSEITLYDGMLLWEDDIPLTVIGNHTIPYNSTEYTIPVVQGFFNYKCLTSSSQDYTYNDELLENIAIVGEDFERVVVEEGFTIENAETDHNRLQILTCNADTEGVLDTDEIIEWTTGISSLDDSSVIVRTYYKGGITILFGDGVLGYKLESSDVLLLKYLETMGRTVTLQSGTPIGSLYLTSITGQVQASLQVDDIITGGSDEDSIEKVRMIVAGYLSTQERAVSPTDWPPIVMAYQGTVNCQVRKSDNKELIDSMFETISEKVENSELPTVQEIAAVWELSYTACCTVEVCMITQNMTDSTHYDWSNPTTYWDDIRDAEFLTYIEAYKMISTRVMVIDPIPKDISIAITINLSIVSDTGELETNIKAKIVEYCYQLGTVFYPTQLSTDISNLETAITRVDITMLQIDGVTVLPYDSVSLEWEEYLRVNSNNVAVTFSYR